MLSVLSKDAARLEPRTHSESRCVFRANMLTRKFVPSLMLLTMATVAFPGVTNCYSHVEHVQVAAGCVSSKQLASLQNSLSLSLLSLLSLSPSLSALSLHYLNVFTV